MIGVFHHWKSIVQLLSHFSCKVISGISDTNHVMLLPMDTKSLATSVDAAYICIPSWRDFANVYCTFRTAGFDKRYELVV